MTTSVTTALPVARAASVVSVAAVVSAVVAFVVTTLAPTGLSPVENAVSEWGLTSYAWGYRWFTVSLTVAALGLLVAVVVRFGRRGIWLAIALAAVAFGRSFVGWVPMDAPGPASTSTGQFHLALGGISFVGFVAAAFVARSLVNGRLRTASLVLGAVGLVTLVVIVGWPDSSVFGLVQRLHYACLVAWLGAFALDGARRGGTVSQVT